MSALEETRERKRDYDRRYYVENRGKIREQQRQLYAANPEKRRERSREWRAANPEKRREHVRKRSAKNQAWINADKLAKGCADCGYQAHPAALDYDHLDPSTKWSAGFVIRSVPRGRAIDRAWSLDRIKAEIAKCEVVCANCHRIRTAKRWETSSV